MFAPLADLKGRHGSDQFTKLSFEGGHKISVALDTIVSVKDAMSSNTKLSLHPSTFLTENLGHGRTLLYVFGDRPVGLVVKASASRAEDPGFESRLRRDFFGVESYQ